MTHRSGSRILDVSSLARVEGEGALHVSVRDGHVESARLDIYEPPRFFEAFLEGRDFREPPDITARICGICPVAYQMSSCRAIESLCGVEIPDGIAELRRLLYCGEWIESHALHIYLLHAPDFLGYPGAIEMAKDHRDIVQRGLRMKQIGNKILEVIGGRAVHPINIRVGGFYSSPSRSDLRGLLADLEWGRRAAQETVRWVSGFEFPDYEGDWDLIAMTDEPGPNRTARYPIMGDRIGSLGGELDIGVPEFPDAITEFQVPHSTALHANWQGRDYLVGPLARYSISGELLPPIAREAADRAGLSKVCRNPYRSIIVRAVEVLAAFDEAIELVDSYVPPPDPSVPVSPRAGVGHGASEAPRGLLYHRYELDESGRILAATIIPPTSQNQPAVEGDLKHVVEQNLQLPDPELTHLCEQTIRNYDPCISCATHFLEVQVDAADPAGRDEDPR